MRLALAIAPGMVAYLPLGHRPGLLDAPQSAGGLSLDGDPRLKPLLEDPGV